MTAARTAFLAVLLGVLVPGAKAAPDGARDGSLPLAVPGADAAPDGARDGSLPLAALERFAVLISSSIARRDDSYAVFHGCLDWHSAVHGHWALLRAARADASLEPLAERADADLTDEGLARELQLLRANPAFELPYGRSWLLRLAIEDELWRAERGRAPSKALRALGDFAARSLLDFYGRYPATPFSFEYENAPWALAQLHDYFVHTGDDGGRVKVDRLAGGLSTAGDSGFDADFGSQGFFSLFGNWAYAVLKTQPPEAARAFLARRPIRDADLRPVTDLMPWPHDPAAKPRPDDHSLGLVWSRAWALAALARSPAVSPADRARFQKAYDAHVAEGLRQFQEYGGDYESYGHWVPQFAVYALTESQPAAAPAPR